MKACKICKFWTIQEKEDNLGNKSNPKIDQKLIGMCHQIYTSCALLKQKRYTYYSDEFIAHPISGHIGLFTVEDFYCKCFRKNSSK